MKNDIYDVAVVGAGVSGASIARKLSAYACDTVVLEKEWDVSFGVSKTNSGVIHGGFHYPTSLLKGRLEVAGNIMFDRLQQELHFPFQRCGILVVAFTVEEMKTVEKLYMQGAANKVIGLELCNRERIQALEPKLNADVVGGLHAPTGGVIEPYRFVFSLIESARKNGVELRTRFKVVKVEQRDDHFLIHGESGPSLKARYLVNAAGLYTDEVSAACDAERFRIKPLKGQEFLLDRNAAGLPGKVIFPVPGAKSKGILVIPTPEGTCMVGPTAVEQEDKEDLSTNQSNFEAIFHSARRLIPKISERDIITAFAGLRPTLQGGDFYIAVSEQQPRLIQVAGIQSPGLTAAPAIGEYVKDLLKSTGLVLTERPDFDPLIDEVPRIRQLSPYEADLLVERDPAYGEIVCRCESVSEAEIVAAIRRGHTTMDGIKFYTRAQMGRCQGGFCSYKIMKILQRETGKSITEISKRGGGSRIITDRVGNLTVEISTTAAGQGDG
ncbi:MAG: NAD(P)/FAD-dependent oxidoreductase [Spirochaetaceae bacterium]|nr:MAG: NAD(P)/FAD-dependent oxidoreductase [Spirochaetaceae bacterium]